MFTNTRTVLRYIDAINKADVDTLYDLMTDDHVFIDAHGNKVEGKTAMKQSWIGYFEMFPDYKIEIKDRLERDNLICILGFASGTYKNIKDKENHWRVPGAWTAIIKNDQIKQWQVYADNAFPIRIISKNEGKDWFAETYG